jgi:hypothetical protein
MAAGTIITEDVEIVCWQFSSADEAGGWPGRERYAITSRAALTKNWLARSKMPEA